MMADLGLPEFSEGSGGPGTRDVCIQASDRTLSAAQEAALRGRRGKGGKDGGKGGRGGGASGYDSDGNPIGGADGDGDEAEGGGKRRRRRHREKRMITSLKGAKVMPTWMVHKAVGTLMQSRIEYELDMARRGEDEEDNQDYGEFVEDRYVELYGLKKIAESNLRDLLKGLKYAPHAHAHAPHAHAHAMRDLLKGLKYVLARCACGRPCQMRHASHAYHMPCPMCGPFAACHELLPGTHRHVPCAICTCTCTRATCTCHAPPATCNPHTLSSWACTTGTQVFL